MSSADLAQLKLVAFDEEDLGILSAHLQDAVVKVGDIAFLPHCKSFVLLARRYDWECDGSEPRRRLSGLYFDRVLRCRSRGIKRDEPSAVLELLAVTFQSTEAPSGTASFVFAGGAAIEIDVECLEARLKDLGPMWSCTTRPAHDLESA